MKVASPAPVHGMVRRGLPSGVRSLPQCTKPLREVVQETMEKLVDGDEPGALMKRPGSFRDRHREDYDKPIWKRHHR